ncbi:MAG: hypothetical protein HY461_01005 [Parcubacteria group bacterium]|nr:hypothetical protein [Parcubacteria group bacterium]
MSNQAKQIRNALSSLRSVKPDSAWKESTYTRLMSQLSLDEKPTVAPVHFYTFLSASSKGMLGRLAWQPIGGVLILFGLIVGPGMVTVNATKGSLPGDSLYLVKRSLERARISLAITDTKKAQLEVDLVSNRLHELQRITKEQAPSPARQQKITLALQELKKDTDTVKTRLEAAKNEPAADKKQEAVELAKIIDQKTADYQQTLDAAVSDLDDESVQTTGTDMGQAMANVQDVAINALDVLVTQPDAKQPLSQEELKTRVQQRLDALKKSVESFQNQLAVQTKAETLPAVVGSQAPQPEHACCLVPEAKPTETSLPASSQAPGPETKPAETAAPTPTTEANPPVTPPVPEVKKEEPAPATPAPTTPPTSTTAPAPAEAKPAETVSAPVVEEPAKVATIEELTKQLQTGSLDLIKQAEELLKLQQFSPALDTLDKANQNLDNLSKQLALRQARTE